MRAKEKPLEEWLGGAVAHLIGADAFRPSDRFHQRTMVQLRGLGFREIPDQDVLADFLVEAGRPFKPDASTLEDLELLAKIQRNGGSLRNERETDRSRRGSGGRRPEADQISSGRHREVVVRPVVAMGRFRG